MIILKYILERRTVVLENKLGITESSVLAREEERLSKKKAVKLFTDELLKNKEVGKFSTLAFIHKCLFEEIYDFAGKVRNVNIEKGDFVLLQLCF